MIIDRYLPELAPTLNRRQFVTLSVGGSVGLALTALPSLSSAQAGLKPQQQPTAFVSIDSAGVVTVLVNRMDMGQGIATALPMALAEELDVPWASVKSGFGDAGAAYTDPLMGMHLTGGSNSIKNSYTQYRELGARTRAMLLAAAAQQWSVSVDTLTTNAGVISGPGGKSATYGALFASAMRLPVPEKVTLKDPSNFKLVGKPTPRKNARAIATGQQSYGIDLQLPGMLTAVIARPPVFGAKLSKLDTSKAEKIAGVRAVLRVPVDRGGEGVAIIADGYWPAKMGRDALLAEWDSAAVARVDSTQQLAEFRALINDKASSAFSKPAEPHFNADISKMTGAPNTLVAEFAFPYLNHAQMEPLACTINLKSDSCDVYTASQMPGVDTGAVAAITGLKATEVKIHVQMGGGGFGRRATISSDYISDATKVALAYKASGKTAPIKVVWSREDDMRAGYYRPSALHRAEIGFDANGTIFGWDHRIISQSIASGTPFEGFMVKNGVDATTTEGMREPYNLPMQLRVHHPKLNVPVLWWRAVGSTHTAYVMETLIDDIARATGQDSVAYRKKLMGDKHPRHLAALDLAVTQSGYGQPLAAGRAYGVAVHESFQSVVAYVVEASIVNGAPKIHRVTAGVHCNFCVNPLTVEAQVQGAAVMALSTTLPGHAITLKNGVVEQGNFHDFPTARITDTPAISVHIAPSNAAPTGMGEPGLPPLAPALANAIAKLMGKAPRNLPFELPLVMAKPA